MPRDKAFYLTVGVSGNEFPAQSLKWPINWTHYNRIDYDGPDAADGNQGTDGGDGGDIVVYYSEQSDCNEYIQLVSQGGLAGDEGNDGQGEKPDGSGSLGGAIVGAVVSAIFSDRGEEGQTGLRKPLSDGRPSGL